MNSVLINVSGHEHRFPLLLLVSVIAVIYDVYTFKALGDDVTVGIGYIYIRPFLWTQTETLPINRQVWPYMSGQYNRER